METGNHLEPGEGWREAGVGGEEWARLQSLLELVRREHQRTELSPERRAQLDKDPVVGVKKPFRPQAKPHVDALGPDSGTMYARRDMLPGLARASHFSWERTARQTDDLLTSLLAANPR